MKKTATYEEYVLEELEQAKKEIESLQYQIDKMRCSSIESTWIHQYLHSKYFPAIVINAINTMVEEWYKENCKDGH